MRRRRQVPPKQVQGCGHVERTWTYRERCQLCQRSTPTLPVDESWREFRRRVIDPSTNGPT